MNILLEEIKKQLELAAELEGEEYKWKCLRNGEVEWLIQQAEKAELYEKTLKEKVEDKECN